MIPQFEYALANWHPKPQNRPHKLFESYLRDAKKPQVSEGNISAMYGALADRSIVRHDKLFESSEVVKSDIQDIQRPDDSWVKSGERVSCDLYPFTEEQFTCSCWVVVRWHCGWLPFALTEVDKGFRRSSGYADLPKLIEALKHQKDSPPKKFPWDCNGTLKRQSIRKPARGGLTRAIPAGSLAA